MGGSSWQIIILLILTIAVFVRLFSEFGKRDSYEGDRKNFSPRPSKEKVPEVFEDQTDLDPYIKEVIAKVTAIEPSFRIDQFLQGAKAAYEMIIMAYLRGEIESVKPFVDNEVYNSFLAAIEARKAEGHVIEAEFMGFQDVKIHSAIFYEKDSELELGVHFAAQLKQVVLDQNGQVVQGVRNKIETERDVWFFSRKMGSSNPNWTLVATDE